MVNKRSLLAVVAFCAMPLQAAYVDFESGDISVDDGGLTASASWDDPASTVYYDVDFDADTLTWKYTYTFEVPHKDVSHMNIEVTAGDDPFSADNILSATDYYELDWHGSQGNSSPGILDDMYGIKWNAATDTTSFTVMIETDRGPMWGDFYAKGGKTAGVFNYAYNTGFGDDVDICFDPAGGVHASCWSDEHILVPNSFEGSIPPEQYVPIPAAVWLFGSGLLGLAAVARRRRT